MRLEFHTLLFSRLFASLAANISARAARAVCTAPPVTPRRGLPFTFVTRAGASVSVSVSKFVHVGGSSASRGERKKERQPRGGGLRPPGGLVGGAATTSQPRVEKLVSVLNCRRDPHSRPGIASRRSSCAGLLAGQEEQPML